MALVVAAGLPELDIRTRAEWRRWLGAHHTASDGVWLVFHKAHTGVACLGYEDAVSEALCFGWIDSLIRRIDDDRFARKFTPRRANSRWSDINRRRWKCLQDQGRLEDAGLRAAPTPRGYEPTDRLLAEVETVPADIETVFREDAAAWSFFASLPKGARRAFVLWIHTAKRSETREKRIRESLSLLRQGKRLGLK